MTDLVSSTTFADIDWNLPASSPLCVVVSSERRPRHEPSVLPACASPSNPRLVSYDGRMTRNGSVQFNYTASLKNDKTVDRESWATWAMDSAAGPSRATNLCASGASGELA